MWLCFLGLVMRAGIYVILFLLTCLVHACTNLLHDSFMSVLVVAFGYRY